MHLKKDIAKIINLVKIFTMQLSLFFGSYRSSRIGVKISVHSYVVSDIMLKRTLKEF